MTADDYPNLRQMAKDGKFYGFEESQHELREALSELDRHHRTFQRISLILDGRSTYAVLTSAEQEIRNIVG